MPIGDVVYNADVACPHPHPHPHPGPKPPFPPMPQPAWFVPPPMPLPIPVDYPSFDPYHPEPKPDDDDDQDDKEKDELKASIEAQICQLSKRAAAIKAMIDNFKNKNKDAILRIGGTSYNFGCYQIIVKKDGEPDEIIETEYGEVILSMLTTELGLIKEKITELAALLEEEDDATTLGNGIYTTVTQG